MDFELQSITKVQFGDDVVDDDNDDDSGVSGGGGGGGSSIFVTQSLQQEEFWSGSHMCSIQQSDISCAVPFACFPQFMHIQNMEDILSIFSNFFRLKEN